MSKVFLKHSVGQNSYFGKADDITDLSYVEDGVNKPHIVVNGFIYMYMVKDEGGVYEESYGDNDYVEGTPEFDFLKKEYIDNPDKTISIRMMNSDPATPTYFVKDKIRRIHMNKYDGKPTGAKIFLEGFFGGFTMDSAMVEDWDKLLEFAESYEKKDEGGAVTEPTPADFFHDPKGFYASYVDWATKHPFPSK